jgi:hypothetical protein
MYSVLRIISVVNVLFVYSFSRKIRCLTSCFINIIWQTCKKTLHFLSFRFHHPKAEIISNSHPEITIKEANKGIQLQDIKCKLKFLSTPAEINQLLLAWPPKISVCDTVKGLSMQLAVAVLNIGPAMAEEQVIVTVLSWLLSFSMVWCWKNFLRNLLLKCSGKAEPQPSNSAFQSN